MDHEDVRQWLAIGSHLLPESYEAEAAQHRAFAGKTSLDDIGGFGFGGSYDDIEYDEDGDYDETDDDEDDEKVEKENLLPPWYNSQPFQYNGRMQLISLPGFILITAITGDLLIGIVTIGSIVIYLLHVAEQKHRAFIAYIVTFFLCHFGVLYSLFPLLWDSFFNFFFLLFVNMFIVLTGAWVTLQFEEFYSKEIDVTRKLETFLYCGYPLVNVIILTWVAAALTHVQLSPYFLLLFGFGVLQIFLYPVKSSFVKAGIPKEIGICEMILDPGFVGLMGLLYAVAPPALHVMITVSTNFNAVFTVNTVMELGFLGFSSFFLATLLDLRLFFQEADVTVATVNQVRWICGVLALLLLSPTLTLHGLQLYFLPWLSVAVIIHASYAYLISHRKTKIYSGFAILSLLGLHAFVFNKLPWQMTYYFSSGLVHISVANALMFATCVLGMLVVFLSVSGPKELFSGAFLLHTTVLLVCEQILLSRGAYPLVLTTVSAAAVIYTGFRLEHSSKLTRTANWIVVSVQLTKALSLCEYVVAARLHQTSVISSTWWMYSYSYLALLLFMLFSTKALFFEDSPEISFNKWQLYVLGSGFTASLQTPMFLPYIYWIIAGTTPSMADIMAVAFALVSIISIRLGMQYPSSWIGARYVGPTLLAMAVTMAHLQPQADFQWKEIWKWLILCSVLSWFTLLPLIANIRNAVVIILLAFPLGAPPSLVLMYMGFGEEYRTITLMLFPLLGSSLVGLVMIVWRSGPGSYKKAFLLITASILMTFVIGAAQGFSDITVLITAAVCLIVIATSTKAINLSLVNLNMDTQINDQKSSLALTGNICSACAFVLLCCLSQKTSMYSEILTVGSSGVLLCLQREGFLRKLRNGNIYAPIVTVTAWVLWWSSVNASLWWHYKNPVHMLTGLVEMTILLLTIPHYVAIIPILWLGKHIVPDKLIIFLLPLQFFLLIFADSYWAWLLMFFSVLTTVWILIPSGAEAPQQTTDNSSPM